MKKWYFELSEDVFGKEDERACKATEYSAISAMLTLTEREFMVLFYRYKHEYTYEKIRLLDINNVISRERVRQIHAKAIRKLRHPSRRILLENLIDINEFYRLAFFEPLNREAKRIDREREIFNLQVKSKTVIKNDKIDSLELSVRSKKCLLNAGIEDLETLVLQSEERLLKIRSFGRKSLNEVKSFLEERGLSLFTE